MLCLADRLRYRPVLVLETCALTGTWLLLVFGSSLRHMQLMQVVFGKSNPGATFLSLFFYIRRLFTCSGVASSAKIAYNSYIYALVDKKDYAKVTSLVRSAALAGKFVAFSLAQLLISTGAGSLLLLNQVS